MDSLISEVKNSTLSKKVCFVCEKNEAKFCIKGVPNNCYCKDCAKEQFSDLSLLEKL